MSRLETILGPHLSHVIEAFSHARMGSFRINTLKSTKEEILTEFESKWIVVTEFDGIPWVYTFDRSHEYAIKGSRAFYDGKIYLQSLASMLPVLALAPEKWGHVLDVCAAPGSKTTQIAMLMKNEWHITALEQNQIRYDKLMYNVRLQWATIIEGKKVDARNFLTRSTDSFDRILIDAPCSAEWRIDVTNEKSYGFWSLENIEKKAELQYDLLSLAVARLRSWGTLVYSTCTLAPEENEWVVARILSLHKDLSLEPIKLGLWGKSWWKQGLTSWDGVEYGDAMKKAVRILPSGETEGFFVVKVKKI